MLPKRETSLWVTTFDRCVMAVITVLATTAILYVIGRPTLGEAVIALLYLLPIGYSTTRWGQAAGICAALTAALAFDFFFIPPFLTFNVGSPEGWMVLIIFLAVAILIIGRIQYGLDQAHLRETQAVFMYELSVALSTLHSPEAIARVLAEKMQMVYQARLVQVMLEQGHGVKVVSCPEDAGAAGKPDRTLPIQTAAGLAGEINLWKGDLPLPAAGDYALQSFSAQAALALERIRQARSLLREAEQA